MAGAYECFHCGERAVVWQTTFSFEEYFDSDEEGIVHVLRCANCGAIITYEVRDEEEIDG